MTLPARSAAGSIAACIVLSVDFDGQELIDPKDMLYCFRIRQRSEKDTFISEDKAGNERKISAHEIHLSCESISIKKEDRSYDRAAEPHLPENET